MSDNVDRKLRVRKPPQYLVGENEETELLGYARANFSKDFVSPAQQLNSMAKILAKFINMANKRLIQKIHDIQNKDTAAAKIRDSNIDHQMRKTERNTQGDKKRVNHKYESKDHNAKTGRDIGNIKGANIDGKDRTTSVEQNKRSGQANKNGKQNSKLDNQGNMGYINKLHQLKQHQSTGLSNLSKHHNQLDAATRAIQHQQQLLLSYNPTLREKLQAQNNTNSRPSSLNSTQNNMSPQNSEKFFRRSTYHIAIAYHIHLNNIKESGKDIQTPMILDPTYHAKRLKGDSQVPAG